MAIAQRVIASAQQYMRLTESALARAQRLPPLCQLPEYPPPYTAVQPPAPPPLIAIDPAQPHPAEKEPQLDEWQVALPPRAGPDDPGRLSAEPTQVHRHKRPRYSHEEPM